MTATNLHFEKLTLAVVWSMDCRKARDISREATTSAAQARNEQGGRKVEMHLEVALTGLTDALDKYKGVKEWEE